MDSRRVPSTAGGTRHGSVRPSRGRIESDQRLVLHEESAVVSKYSEIQLCTQQTQPPPSPAFRLNLRSGLGSSPDKPLVSATRLAINIVIVLDLESGDSQLVTDAGVKICDLRVAGNAIAAVGDGGIVTWNLSAGDHVFDAKANINGGVWATMFDHPARSSRRLHPALISPSLDSDVLITRRAGNGLDIYDTSTGKHPRRTTGGRRFRGVKESLDCLRREPVYFGCRQVRWRCMLCSPDPYYS